MELLDFSSFLKSYNLKATPQRVIFLKELYNAGHLSIEEIEKRVKNIIPTISVATIYKNINAMVEKGLLKEVKIQGEKTKYEIKKENHAHFVCKICKNVYDIEFAETYLSDSLNLPKGFLFAEINLVIKGICPKCNAL
jgi:Fur family peroxide stress response transcriptional regulator